MKSITIEQVAVILGVITGAIVIWKAALTAARSTLLGKMEERLKRTEDRLDDHDEDIERNTTRTDNLYDRLIQKNS